MFKFSKLAQFISIGVRKEGEKLICNNNNYSRVVEAAFTHTTFKARLDDR